MPRIACTVDGCTAPYTLSKHRVDTVINSAAMLKEGHSQPKTGVDKSYYGKLRGVDLVFRDVTVTVGETEILHDVSGMVRRGEMLAIMGPSGAGKSTLLNTLARRLPFNSGDITLNTQPLDKQMRRKICYVLQDDVFFSNLTLRETLTFTAMLRLPEKMKSSEKIQRVEKIVDTLDLRKCLETVIGDALIPGLSGGEKKRANIACELLTNPMLMLLDEPTSGLDSAIAANLMTTLKMYTQTFNKTIVTTIHQPSSAIFHMFDWVLLLTNGHVAYFGPGEQIMNFFANLGLVCTPQYNPAEFILEKLKESQQTADMVTSAAYECRRTEKWPTELRSKKWILDNQAAPAYIVDVRKQMDNVIKTDLVVVDVGSDDILDDELDIMYDPNKKWQTGFWTQYTTLTHRNVIQSYQRILSKLNMFQTFFLTLMSSMLWFQLPRTEQTISDRAGLLYFSQLYWSMFAMFDAVITFPAERAMIRKERQSGVYRVSAYYCAKMTSELPITLLQPILFYSVVYWICDLNNDVATFFASLGMLLFVTMASQSISLFVGTIAQNVTTGVMVGTVVLLSSNLAGGFYRQFVPPYFVWLNYLSILHYSYDAMVVLEFHNGDPISCLSAGLSAFPECSVLDASNKTRFISGASVLKSKNLNTSIWLNLTVLALVVILFRFAGYLALRFYDPTRKPATINNRKVKSSSQHTTSNQVSPLHQDKPHRNQQGYIFTGRDQVIDTQIHITYI